LGELKKQGSPPLELTDAIEKIRKPGCPVYALELEERREDVGELLASAGELIRER
jgi:hypothetical protein